MKRSIRPRQPLPRLCQAEVAVRCGLTIGMFKSRLEWRPLLGAFMVRRGVRREVEPEDLHHFLKAARAFKKDREHRMAI